MVSSFSVHYIPAQSVDSCEAHVPACFTPFSVFPARCSSNTSLHSGRRSNQNASGMADPIYDVWARDMFESSIRRGVSITPTVYINGVASVILSGHDGFHSWNDVLGTVVYSGTLAERLGSSGFGYKTDGMYDDDVHLFEGNSRYGSTMAAAGEQPSRRFEATESSEYESARRL